MTTACIHSPIANMIATPARSAVAPSSERISVAGKTARSAITQTAHSAAKTGRIVAAWPSFALIGSYELLMRQIRATAATAAARRGLAQSATALFRCSKHQ